MFWVVGEGVTLRVRIKSLGFWGGGSKVTPKSQQTRVLATVASVCVRAFLGGISRFRAFHVKG